VALTSILESGKKTSRKNDAMHVLRCFELFNVDEVGQTRGRDEREGNSTR
jgi:hypothetical protein